MGGVVQGFRIGNSCTPMADSCQCMAKPIQYCKVKFKKKILTIKNFKKQLFEVLIKFYTILWIF